MGSRPKATCESLATFVDVSRGSHAKSEGLQTANMGGKPHEARNPMLVSGSRLASSVWQDQLLPAKAKEATARAG